MTRINTGLFAIVATLAMAPAADAHPHLMAAGPAPGSIVTASPKALRVQFNEGIVLGFSGLEITNAAGKKQKIGSASLNPKDDKQLVVSLKTALAPGKYMVAWHAVGDDTHRVKGTYNFEIKPKL